MIYKTLMSTKSLKSVRAFLTQRFIANFLFLEAKANKFATQSLTVSFINQLVDSSLLFEFF